MRSNQSECMNTTTEWSWCFVDEDRWDYCSSKAGVSSKGTLCLDACTKYDGQNFYTCLVSKSLKGQTREICSRPPYTPGFWYLNDQVGSILNDSLKNNEIHFEKAVTSESELSALQNISKEYEEQFEAIFYQEDGQAPVYFTSMEVGNVSIVLTMRATLTLETLPLRNEMASEFPDDVDERMEDLQSERKDKKAYILGPMLGGPISLFNIVPQMCIANLGLCNEWKIIEKTLSKGLQIGAITSIDWQAVLHYDSDDFKPTNLRPKAIGLHYTSRYVDGQTKTSGDHFFVNKNPVQKSGVRQ